MNKQQFDELKKSLSLAHDTLDKARFAVSQLERTFRLFACKECGGSGNVDVSREPCSTAICDCSNCDGKGFN
jgi:excinuclease UvrABC ATPase subunit